VITGFCRLTLFVRNGKNSDKVGLQLVPSILPFEHGGQRGRNTYLNLIFMYGLF